VQGDDPATFGASPLFFFLAQVLFHPYRFGADSVLDQADVVSQPVAFINLFDKGAGKRFALETEGNSPAFGAGFDFTAVAIPGFGGYVSITARA
jgi:hypothetical protein